MNLQRCSPETIMNVIGPCNCMSLAIHPTTLPIHIHNLHDRITAPQLLTPPNPATATQLRYIRDEDMKWNVLITCRFLVTSERSHATRGVLMPKREGSYQVNGTGPRLPFR